MDRLYEDFSDCEVDHSFFDSDFEEEAKKQRAATEADGKEQGERSEVANAIMDNHDLTSEAKVVEDNCAEEKGLEGKETESQQERTSDTDANSVAPLLRSQNSENPGTSGSITVQRICENTTEIPPVVKDSEENYYTDEEDSSDDSRTKKVRLKSSKQSSNAKPNKNIAAGSSSSSSSPSCSSISDCSDTDSDGCLSDSSCSSAKEKSICNLAYPSAVQKSSPGKNPVEVKPKLGDCAEESEDTVTDVTPLSTPDISPIQSFEVAASNENKLKVKRQENVSQDLDEPDMDRRCQQKVLHEAMDLNHLLKAFLQLEKKEQEEMVLDQSCMRSKKNFSFTNEEVRQIDRENQRLLKELTKYSTKSRSKSASLRKPPCPTPKMYHSAINRQREQQRIDRENLAFLKRLEAVKPTVGMKRSEQLMDYQRQMSYLNSAPTPRRGKSALSHHSPSRASRTSSHSASSTASRRSERPVFDSSGGTLQRLNTSSIRGAWL